MHVVSATVGLKVVVPILMMIGMITVGMLVVIVEVKALRPTIVTGYDCPSLLACTVVVHIWSPVPARAAALASSRLKFLAGMTVVYGVSFGSFCCSSCPNVAGTTAHNRTVTQSKRIVRFT